MSRSGVDNYFDFNNCYYFNQEDKDNEQKKKNLRHNTRPSQKFRLLIIKICTRLRYKFGQKASWCVQEQRTR